MFTGIIGCILAGCLQDVPIIVSNRPIETTFKVLTHKPKSIDKSQYSCYVEGEFYTSCPTK